MLSRFHCTTQRTTVRKYARNDGHSYRIRRKSICTTRFDLITVSIDRETLRSTNLPVVSECPSQTVRRINGVKDFSRLSVLWRERTLNVFFFFFRSRLYPNVSPLESQLPRSHSHSRSTRRKSGGLRSYEKPSYSSYKINVAFFIAYNVLLSRFSESRRGRISVTLSPVQDVRLRANYWIAKAMRKEISFIATLEYIPISI